MRPRAAPASETRGDPGLHRRRSAVLAHAEDPLRSRSSVVVGWLLEEPAVADARAILRLFHDQAAIVPPSWSLEVCHAVREAGRTGRITPADQVRFQQALFALPTEFDSPSVARDWTAILPLSLQRHLSTYDAAYLELALREDLPLATFDVPLRAAAGGLGIACLGPAGQA